MASMRCWPASTEQRNSPAGNCWSITTPTRMSSARLQPGRVHPPACDWLNLAEAITDVQATAANAATPNRRRRWWMSWPDALHRPHTDPTRGELAMRRPCWHSCCNDRWCMTSGPDLALGGRSSAGATGRCSPAWAHRGWRGLLNLGNRQSTLIPPRCNPYRSAPVLGWTALPTA